MQLTLAATALLMGIAGGPHCAAMCGAACAAIGRMGRVGTAQKDIPQKIIPINASPGFQSTLQSGGEAAQRPRLDQEKAVTPAMWTFLTGRLAGYAALGGFAAASMQGLGWLSIHSAALRPVWTLFHVAAALLGLMLLWQARQPVWLEDGARNVWRKVQALTGSGQASSSCLSRLRAPLFIGVLWALLPCGLLYSALLVAALTANPVEGALVMALFALGSSLSLMAGPWLWLRLRGMGSGRSRAGRAGDSSGQWAIRLAGLALFAVSGWALWMGLVHDTAPWCITP